MANVRSEARLEVLLAVKKKLAKACFDDESLPASHVEVLANLIGAVDEAIISEVDVMTKWARE